MSAHLVANSALLCFDVVHEKQYPCDIKSGHHSTLQASDLANLVPFWCLDLVFALFGSCRFSLFQYAVRFVTAT